MFCSTENYIYMFLIILILIVILNCGVLETFSSNDKITVINYNTKWCGYSRQLQPIWDKLMKKYQSDNQVELLDVKCDENEEKCKNTNLRGFPTIILYKKNQAFEYDGNRTIEDIEKFIEQKKTS